MENSHSFASLLLVLFLAFLVPLFLRRFNRLRIPIVVGELVAGVVIGRSFLDLVPREEPVLELLAELGFVFLMFLAGMEIDFSDMRPAGGALGDRRGAGPLALAVIYFGITLVLAGVAGLALATAGLVENGWMIALVLSTTSLGVVVPVLKEHGLAEGPYGQTILAAAMVADFITMILITVLVALLSNTANLRILLIGVLFVVFFAVYRSANLFFSRIPGLRQAMDELSHASAQIKVRAAFTIMLVFVVLAEALGTELVLGAFMAGAVISLLMTPDDEQLAGKLEAIGFGFFIPIFFIVVGIRFDVQALFSTSQTLLLVPLLLGAAALVKLAPAAVFRVRFGSRESLAAGVLLSTRLSLIIAASAIGLRLGIITDAENSAIIVVAAATVTLAPVIFARLAPSAAGTSPLIVVSSTGELGLKVAERLHRHGEPVVVLDADPENVERARRRGIEAVCADPADPAAAPWLEAATALVCTSSDKLFNYRICQAARVLHGIKHIVVQVNDPQDRSLFEKMGVRTLNPALDRVSLFALLGRSPDLYQLLTRTGDDMSTRDMTMHNERIAGLPLKQLELPGDLLVLAIRRGNELLVPQGDTRLESGDRLTLVGSVESVEKARRLFAPAR